MSTADPSRELSDVESQLAKNLGLPPGAAVAFGEGTDPARLLAELRKRSRRKAALKGWARRRGDWRAYLDLHGHAEALLAFVRVADDIEDDALYWELLSDTWTRTEAPSADAALWRALLAGDRPRREAMMTAEERDALAAMPEVLTVYRGAGHPDYADGLAWTLDRGRAAWFAGYAPLALARSWVPGRVRSGEPVLATGTVARGDVIAYLTERQEAEVLVLPSAVQVQSVEPVDPEVS